MDGWKVVTVVSSSGLFLLALQCGSAPRATAPQQSQTQSGPAAMRTARSELSVARRYLDQATADRGGHREQAIHMVDQAMWEIDQDIGPASTVSVPQGQP